MQDRTEIVRSPAALNYQIVFFSITYFVLALICIYVLLVPFRYFDSKGLLWFLVLTGIALILYVLSVAVLKRSWSAVRYYLAKDCLVISSGFGSTREDVYRYESIDNVSLQQTNTEKSRTYGRLVLSIDKVPAPITLKYVTRPNDVLEALQANITTASRITKR